MWKEVADFFARNLKDITHWVKENPERVMETLKEGLRYTAGFTGGGGAEAQRRVLELEDRVRLMEADVARMRDEAKEREALLRQKENLLAEQREANQRLQAERDKLARQLTSLTDFGRLTRLVAVVVLGAWGLTRASLGQTWADPMWVPVLGGVLAASLEFLWMRSRVR